MLQLLQLMLLLQLLPLLLCYWYFKYCTAPAMSVINTTVVLLPLCYYNNKNCTAVICIKLLFPKSDSVFVMNNGASRGRCTSVWGGGWGGMKECVSVCVLLCVCVYSVCNSIYVTCPQCITTCLNLIYWHYIQASCWHTENTAAVLTVQLYCSTTGTISVENYL